MISIQEITKLAELARIELTEKEKNELQNDMEAILDYFKKLKWLNTDGQTEFLTTSNLNELREDKKSRIQDELQKTLLSQAPETKNGYLKVKKIL